MNTSEILETTYCPNFLKDQKNKIETLSKVQDFEPETNMDSRSTLRGVLSLAGFWFWWKRNFPDLSGLVGTRVFFPTNRNCSPLPIVNTVSMVVKYPWINV